ncbi:hypothetical protein FFI89_018785 [Bradyrhizobium sp. KBS0727]|uniref:hypothetical protein n=1 Tax=unclassified Bradyrhizobium TaxID=2631580 RepID=UPI00110EBA26|nr:MULTISPECIES: hypothetical protein [unclassified Bradyrhizobium]QDW39012.1 hypothetical protein FFI71_018785 [Bradyrhizobium sp. KBS0725]QDW45615.1 hypothetical protein FFI89_018785 [Bradyrhizobium sp. KBS0727]
MTIVTPTGGQKYWYNGVAFEGLKKSGATSGDSKYWYGGVASPFLFGVSTQNLTLAGFASVNGFGAPVLTAGAVTLSLAGFADSNGFGGPSLSPGAVTLSLAGFADSNAFGAPALSLNLALTGIASGDAFGSATLSPGAVTLALAGFADSNAFGTPALAGGAVTLSLSGFAAVNGFGALQLSVGTVDLSLSGVAAVNAFGVPTLTPRYTLTLAAGIANSNGFGAPRLTPAAVTLTLAGMAAVNRFGAPQLIPGPVTVALTALADLDRFGVPVLQLKKKTGQGGGTKPGGVGAAQKYATRLTLSEAGLIVALEAQSSVAKNVNTRMALYADVAGLPGALLAQSAVKTQVAIGSNSYPLLVPRAVPANTSLWAALHSDGNFNWFLSAGPNSRFNADAFADGPSDPFGASTLQNSKAPVFVVFLEAITLQLTATGFASANAFGAPTLFPPFAQTLALSGFADTDGFGTPTLVPDQALQLSGVAAVNGFGAPQLKPVSTTLTLSGLSNASGFGAPELKVAAALVLSGFADPDGFGTLSLERAIEPSIDEALLLRSRHQRTRELANETPRVRILSNPIGGLRPRGRRLLENAGS